MTAADYAARLAGEFCLACPGPSETARAGRDQRRCRVCRRRWRYGNRRQEWDLLRAYAEGRSVRGAADSAAASPETARKKYDEFRRALAAAVTRETADRLRAARPGRATDGIAAVVAELDRQAEGFKSTGRVGRVTEAVLAAGGVVFVTPAMPAEVESVVRAAAGGVVVRVPVDDLLRSGRAGGLTLFGEDIRALVRGDRQVPPALRPAAVCEAAARARMSRPGIVAAVFRGLIAPELAGAEDAPARRPPRRTSR